MYVPKAVGLPLCRLVARVGFCYDVWPLLFTVKLLEHLLVLTLHGCQVMVEVNPQGVPEEFPPHDAAGDRVHEAMAVPVSVHGDEDLLLGLVGLLQLLQDGVQVTHGAGPVASVSHRFQKALFYGEHPFGKFRAVEDVTVAQLLERLWLVGFVHAVLCKQRGEQLALVIRNAFDFDQLRCFPLRPGHFPRLGYLNAHSSLAVGQLSAVLQVLGAVPLPTFGAFYTGFVSGKDERCVAFWIRTRS